MASSIKRVALCAMLLLPACNAIVGLSKLEEVDCVTNCGSGSGAGGGADGGAVTPIAVWLGRGHTCATMADGTLQCWGSNGNGQLGDGTTTPHPRPMPGPGRSGVTYVALGLNHTCAVTPSGVYCWGANARGQLGDGTTKDRPQPVLVKGLVGSASKIQAGEEHTCAEMVDGSVQGWGSKVSGQIGDGTNTDRPLPTKVPLTTTVKKLSSGGGAHNCAALNDGNVWCWGLNDKFQLGNSVMMSSSDPVQVMGISGVKKVWVGRQHSCALLGDATVQCWGANDFGQLGDGTTNQRAQPAQVMGLSDMVGGG